jgi:hypothetical protein
MKIKILIRNLHYDVANGSVHALNIDFISGEGIFQTIKTGKEIMEILMQNTEIEVELERKDHEN